MVVCVCIACIFFVCVSIRGVFWECNDSAVRMLLGAVRGLLRPLGNAALWKPLRQKPLATWEWKQFLIYLIYVIHPSVDSLLLPVFLFLPPFCFMFCPTTSFFLLDGQIYTACWNDWCCHFCWRIVLSAVYPVTFHQLNMQFEFWKTLYKMTEQWIRKKSGTNW